MRYLIILLILSCCSQKVLSPIEAKAKEEKSKKHTPIIVFSLWFGLFYAFK